MNYKLFFSLFTLSLFAASVTAQIDEDGQPLIGVVIECNNLDQGDFEDDLEDLLDTYTFNNSDGSCGGTPTYVSGSAVVNNYPVNCVDLVEVDLTVDCGGSDVDITVEIEVVDNEDPFDFDTDSNLEDPNVSAEQCDIAQTQADIDAWIADIEANSLNGNQVFDDNCSNDPTTLDITALNPPVVDFTSCAEMVYSVDFEVIDECGNVANIFTYEYEVIDDEAPTVILSLIHI